MDQKSSLTFSIILISTFISVQSYGLFGLLPQFSSLERSISLSGSIRAGPSVMSQISAIRNGVLTSSQSSSINGGGSTTSQSSSVNGGKSTQLQSANVNSGGLASLQASTVNGGRLASPQSSIASGGRLASLQSSTASGGRLASSQSSTSSGGVFTSSPISGRSFSSSQAKSTMKTGASSSPQSSSASFGFLQSPTVNRASAPLLQSSVTKYDSTTFMQFNLDPLTEAKVEQFAQSLTQLLKSNKAIAVPGNSLVYPIYETTLAAVNTVFDKFGVNNPALAHHIAQVTDKISVFTLNLYYNVMSHNIAKVLGLKGLLTDDFLVYGPKVVAEFIADFTKVNGAEDSKAVVAAVFNGIYDFVDSLGLANLENINLSNSVYESYVTRLANGELV